MPRQRCASCRGSVIRLFYIKWNFFNRNLGMKTEKLFVKNRPNVCFLNISPMAAGVKFSSLCSLVCVGTVAGIISSEMLDLNCLVEPFFSVEVEPICFLEPVCPI